MNECDKIFYSKVSMLCIKYNEGLFMNAFITVIPLIFIRYVLLSVLSKEALKRAALFAPLRGMEKVAYWFYQISTILIFVYLCFLKITNEALWLYIGLAVYGLGVLLCIVTTFNYASPSKKSMNSNGLYQFSRNPMYVAYFIYFLGCCILTHSLVLLIILLVMQLSAHWIIISEERWCINKFGQEYVDYMKKVRRYI